MIAERSALKEAPVSHPGKGQRSKVREHGRGSGGKRERVGRKAVNHYLVGMTETVVPLSLHKIHSITIPIQDRECHSQVPTPP